MQRVDPRDKTNLIEPLYAAGPRFWLAVAGLLAVIGWGGVMYARQLWFGLGETSMSRPAYWGVYIVNFIFLIGVSMAGTLISASLHLVNAEWRRPLTRIAESLTVFGLAVAGLQILFDMGRPDRVLYMVQYGRLQSPLLWDAASLTVYILASLTALYLEVLPDLAILRDNLPERCPAWRRWLYTQLSLGWRGNRTQWRRLHRAMTGIAIAIIPIGVSLHTVTSWIFSTTVQPGWKSTILGPYFVVGAVFSGLGLLLVVITLARRWLPVRGYLGERQYRNLGWLFIVMSIVWFYFTYTENLTLAAEQEPLEFTVLASKLWGEFAPGYWLMVALMVLAFWVMLVPRLLPARAPRLAVLRPRLAPVWAAGAAVMVFALAVPESLPARAALMLPTPRGLVVVLLVALLGMAGLSLASWLKPRPEAMAVLAGVSVVAAMWLERWNIIVPTVTHPRLVAYASYFPSLTEISLSAASVALLALMLIIFYKLVPAVSIWEVAEGRLVAEATAKLVIGEPAANEPARRPVSSVRP